MKFPWSRKAHSYPILRLPHEIKWIYTTLSNTSGFYSPRQSYLGLIRAGKTQDELLAVWLQEAKAAIGGKKKGGVVDIWKVIGERKVGS